jgi:hypothetical protein
MNRPSCIRGFQVWLLAGTTAAALAFSSSTQRIGLPAIAAPMYRKIPAGYRNWELISVAILGTPFNDIRAKLGNDLAVNALRDKKFPLPDGAMIARLAWKQVSSSVNNDAFRQDPSGENLNAAALQRLLGTSFAAGRATNVQFMVRDAKKYAATGGWGFFQFTNGRPDRIVQISCFVCHTSARTTDFVFTRYSP